jgi:hypothetical protein
MKTKALKCKIALSIADRKYLKDLLLQHNNLQNIEREIIINESN